MAKKLSFVELLYGVQKFTATATLVLFATLLTKFLRQSPSAVSSKAMTPFVFAEANAKLGNNERHGAIQSELYPHDVCEVAEVESRDKD